MRFLCLYFMVLVFIVIFCWIVTHCRKFQFCYFHIHTERVPNYIRRFYMATFFFSFIPHTSFSLARLQLFIITTTIVGLVLNLKLNNNFVPVKIANITIQRSYDFRFIALYSRYSGGACLAVSIIFGCGNRLIFQKTLLIKIIVIMPV